MDARVQRLVELLPEAGIELLLVTDLVNVRYLTGYTGSNGLAVVGPETRAFVTDFRYLEQSAREVDPSFTRLIAANDLLDLVLDALPEGETRVGFEDAHLTVRQHQGLREALPGRVELVAGGSLVERLRAIKEPREIELIRAAAAVADEAFNQVLAAGLVGRTERTVAHELERQMLERGAERPSFGSIVAAGPQGALPHAQTRDVEIRTGDTVVIDWGAVLDGYCSDCTRTVAAGAPSADAQEVYQLVLDAQLAGVEAVRPGASEQAVDMSAREIIAAAGHGEHFGHGLGHGVGLDIHEAPRLSQRAEGELRAGNVVTVEPGVYLPGRFGVRIEDLVVVRDDGAEILTSVGKDLMVVD